MSMIQKVSVEYPGMSRLMLNPHERQSRFVSAHSPPFWSKLLNRDRIIDQVKNLKTNMAGGVCSPHKPLLLLHAIGRLQQGKRQFQNWKEIEPQLTNLLSRFGWQNTPRPGRNPHYPFRFLINDGLWEVPEAGQLKEGNDGSFLLSDLNALDPKGGLPDEIYTHLLENPALTAEIVQLLLHEYFPEILHQEILQAVSLAEIVEQYRGYVPSHKLWRNPKFPREVVNAYQKKCAICDQHLLVTDEPFNLEAAHIRPVCAKGPDKIENGLAMCTLHHRAFDRGLIGLQGNPASYKIIVSEQVTGESRQMLLALKDREVRRPQSEEFSPADEYVRFHRKHYFRGANA